MPILQDIGKETKVQETKVQKTITYNHKKQSIDCVYYQNAVQSYPTHTHASHHTFGLVSDGMVCIVCNGEKRIYGVGQYFYIQPDVPHAIEQVKDKKYSMISVCIPVGEIREWDDADEHYIKRLKRMIMETPEDPLSIKDMAETISVSPYHMIRQFKSFCGLTPHQFQIQCRVRKAQKILEEGKSVTEAAYAAGFCDQSHFDRCFQRIVRLTPSEYRQALC